LGHLQTCGWPNLKLKHVFTRQTACLIKVVVVRLILILFIHVSACNLLTRVGTWCRVHKPRLENRRNLWHSR